MRSLGVPSVSLDGPGHLAGLPECLHKYGPLFAEQLAQPRTSDEAGAA
jgi:hypothetical protein